MVAALDFVVSINEENLVYTGTVNITEALGEVTLLYFDPEGGADPIIGKLQGIHKGLRGREVSLVADPAKVHIFHDTQSLLYRDRPVIRIPTRAH